MPIFKIAILENKKQHYFSVANEYENIQVSEISEVLEDKDFSYLIIKYKSLNDLFQFSQVIGWNMCEEELTKV